MKPLQAHIALWGCLSLWFHDIPFSVCSFGSIPTGGPHRGGWSCPLRGAKKHKFRFRSAFASSWVRITWLLGREGEKWKGWKIVLAAGEHEVMPRPVEEFLNTSEYRPSVSLCVSLFVFGLLYQSVGRISPLRYSTRTTAALLCRKRNLVSDHRHILGTFSATFAGLRKAH